MNRIPAGTYKALHHLPSCTEAENGLVVSYPFLAILPHTYAEYASVPAEPSSEDWVLSRYLGKSNLGAGMNIYNVRYENHFALALSSPALCLPMCPDLFQLAIKKESELPPTPRA